MLSPIFISGGGRSGTTLLAMMLDSHRNIAMGAEYPLTLNGDFTVGDLLLVTNRSKRLPMGHRLEKAWRSKDRAERCGVLPKELAVVLRGIPGSTGSRGHSLVIDGMGGVLLRKTGKTRWGFKIMLDAHHVDVYQEIWPECRIVHVVRDGRDSYASERAFGWGTKDVRDAAAKWVDLNAPRRGVLMVRYESLVRNPSDTMKEILEWVGEDWDDNVLRHEAMPHLFHSMTRVRHPSRAQTKRKIYTGKIGRHRSDLTPEEIAAYESIAMDRLEELGYARSS